MPGLAPGSWRGEGESAAGSPNRLAIEAGPVFNLRLGQGQSRSEGEPEGGSSEA